MTTFPIVVLPFDSGSRIFGVGPRFNSGNALHVFSCLQGYLEDDPQKLGTGARYADGESETD